ncbi:MAG: hypothetical protein ACKPKT_03495 [Dolichospermum sp.]
MFIKVSQLMAISLLLLAGCSGKSNNTSDSNLPGSSSTPPSNVPTDQFPSANIPPDHPAPDQNPTDSVIVGRWQSRYNANAPISGNYQIITTVEFYSDGTYEFRLYDTSNDPIALSRRGQWKRTDKNTIFANNKNPDSGKVDEVEYRIIDQDTIINSYGYTFIRLP